MHYAGLRLESRFLPYVETASGKSRGYGIALSHFGHSSVDFGLLEEVRPPIVKLALALFASGRSLHRLIDRVHALGILVMAEGVDLSALHPGAAATDIDLLLAHAPGGCPRPAPRLRPWHAAIAEPVDIVDVSLGLESIEDILWDIDQALSKT